MKGVLAWIIGLLLCSANLMGQGMDDGGENQFGGGLRLGLSTSQIDGDGYTGFHKFGLASGLFVNTDLSDNIDVQLEMLYIQKGSRRNVDSLNRNFYRIALNYIEVPLMFRFGHKRFLFEIGPSIGFLVGEKEEDFNSVVSQSLFDWRATETSVKMGINFFVTENLLSNVRISRSILPISDNVVVDPRFGFIGGSYNEVISFNLFYSFL